VTGIKTFIFIHYLLIYSVLIKIKILTRYFSFHLSTWLTMNIKTCYGHQNIWKML